MPRRMGLSLSEWPRLDLGSWSRAVASASFFDERAVAAHWRPKTRMQAEYAHGRWLAYLRDQDPALPGLPPEARDTPERMQHYVETLALRLTGMSIAAELQHLSLAFRAISPKVDWSWVRKRQSAYQQRARPPGRFFKGGLANRSRSGAWGTHLSLSVAFRRRRVSQI